MNEKPILFNAEMVNAILSGRKTQTRRIMKVQPSEHFHPQTIHGAMDFTAHWYTPGVIDKDGYLQPARKDVFGVADEDEGYTCPLGAVGDQLWVRETFGDCGVRLVYRADYDDGAACIVKRWTPSIHMPRWASRINLLITGVRVERLQDISEQDAMAEGIDADYLAESQDHYDCIADHNMTGRPTAKGYFSNLWQSIYGEESWEANSWVWVINFERMEAK